MKFFHTIKNLPTLCAITILITTSVHGKISDNIQDKIPRVIYGQDNRIEVDSYPDRLFRDSAKSVAGMVTKDMLIMKNGKYKIIISDQNSSLKICKNEKFYKQIAPIICSGFLIAKNLLLTAGHCVTSKSVCNNLKWIFEYKNQTSKIPSNNVYSCKKIIATGIRSKDKRDFSIIELDRDVEDRVPLELNFENNLTINQELVIIGHPAGLSMKIADNGFVRSNANPNYFVANLDSFHGNSGSPVFNKKTGLVEGVLVRGEQDFIHDIANKCFKIKRCLNESCRGEDVLKINAINKSFSMNQYL